MTVGDVVAGAAFLSLVAMGWWVLIVGFSWTVVAAGVFWLLVGLAAAVKPGEWERKQGNRETGR